MITLFILSGIGLSNISTASINTGNNPPSPPTITGPVYGKPGVAYEFSFNSVDIDGDNVSYYIEWGDGTSDGWTEYFPSGTDVIISHLWEEVSWYNIIQAKAKDIHGNESEWSTYYIPISNKKANAMVASDKDETYLVKGSAKGNLPLPPVMWTEDFYTFYIPTPENPDGDDVRYYIDWGDGTSETTVYYAPGETAIITHIWTEEGTFEIEVKAEDPDGESKCAVYTLTLSTDFKFFGVKIGYVDIIYTFTIYWNDGCDCYLMIDWGDGEPTEWLGPYEQPFLFFYSWDLTGQYEIKIKMKDIYGYESDWLSYIVTILNPENNAPNKPEITGKWIIRDIELECYFISIDPDGDDVKYYIDWDDGLTEITDFYKSGEKATVSHIYAAQGCYIITAFAVDIHGAEGPTNTFIPRCKPKAFNNNPVFLRLLGEFPLIEKFFSYIF